MSTKHSNKVRSRRNKVRNRETKVDIKLKGKVKAFTKVRKIEIQIWPQRLFCRTGKLVRSQAPKEKGKSNSRE